MAQTKMTQTATAWQSGFDAGAAGVPVTRCPADAGTVVAQQAATGEIALIVTRRGS